MNGKLRAETQGAAKQERVTDEVVSKLMKIRELKEVREVSIMEQKKSAVRNQEQLSQMIKQVNETISKTQG